MTGGGVRGFIIRHAQLPVRFTPDPEIPKIPETIFSHGKTNRHTYQEEDVINHRLREVMCLVHQRGITIGCLKDAECPKTINFDDDDLRNEDNTQIPDPA